MPTQKPYTFAIRTSQRLTKNCKRVCLANARTENAAKMKDKLTGKINNETLTRGIKHWGLGGYSSILPRIKFGVTGQDISPQSPTVSYRKTLGASVKKDHDNLIR